MRWWRTGTTVPTDLDICYARTQNNARALLRALGHLHAEVLDADDDPHPLPVDFRALQHGDVFTFTTDAGDLDCMTAPDGTTGFEDVAPGAIRVPFRGLVARVASLDDLIRMKQASGQKQRRGKDRDDLAALLRIREEERATARQLQTETSGNRIWIEGYERANGKKVAGHWRGLPGGVLR